MLRPGSCGGGGNCDVATTDKAERVHFLHYWLGSFEKREDERYQTDRAKVGANWSQVFVFCRIDTHTLTVFPWNTSPFRGNIDDVNKNDDEISYFLSFPKHTLEYTNNLDSFSMHVLCQTCHSIHGHQTCTSYGVCQCSHFMEWRHSIWDNKYK